MNKNIIQCEIIKETIWVDKPSTEQLICWVNKYAEEVRKLLNEWKEKEEIIEIINNSKTYGDDICNFINESHKRIVKITNNLIK